MDFPTLRTERLTLREITQRDAPALLAIHGDADAMRWYGTDPISSLEQARAMVETFAGWRSLPAPGVRWGLARREDDALIGSLGLFKWNRGWRSCTLGYELARACQGQGLMGEALRAALAWGFEHMELNRIEAQVHPDNQASLTLLERLDFKVEGRARQAGFWLGRHQDLITHSLLREDSALATA
ncbi:GNAT family N-acetyltransferase [Chromobacterium subtsugae]|uniref:GNAT family N-acetyltransferase n=2 Tax=Chromobacterium subtsugae TaxID=251747 RepID=A0ABS7FFR9_9NEIS|nr:MULTISPECIES: GNAT family protein [Chromobacterium]KUM03972.1 GNAT family acetyltransferase [Chromobacterium subtsugae]KZE86433.1 GNAT family acetyltransferase [Chromobacterium sp. F49]MBW7567692.1 GNAT family N-acetyltransferase [Chromobacterium subtsugae]MBW8288918.1 GNAT family N-acetyltransferase [Chromobacterium subtsugae]OBU85693.1 GNAT family acetyltransferase [Chromobacterium subtsugae]